MVTTDMEHWSEAIWVELGASMDPEPAGEVVVPMTGPPVVFGPEQVRAVVEPIVNREKQFRLADRTKARYRILLASKPEADTETPNVAILPELSDEFIKYLGQSGGAAASDDLRELFRTKLAVANTSTQCLEKDVTLEPDNLTLAFSDRVRTFAWLAEKLRTTSFSAAKNQLGLLQFLTPDREALAVLAEGDSQVKSLIMANSTSNSAQLDASKTSKLYCDGRLANFRHVYEAFCNLRLFLSITGADVNKALVIMKMQEYVEILVDRQGRLFFEACRRQPHLAVHPWQDLQHISLRF